MNDPRGVCLKHGIVRGTVRQDVDGYPELVCDRCGGPVQQRGRTEVTPTPTWIAGPVTEDNIPRPPGSPERPTDDVEREARAAMRDDIESAMRRYYGPDDSNP